MRDHPPVLEADDRLEHDVQIIVHAGCPQRLLDLQPPPPRRFHAQFEHRDSARGAGLGLVQGEVGIGHDARGGPVLARAAKCRSRSDAETSNSRPPIRTGPIDSVEDCGADRMGVRRVAHVGKEHAELVAAEPRDEPAAPTALDQARRDFLKQLVAGAVAERIVDRLEAVEVEHGDRERLLAAGLDLRFERGDERAAIGQAGQKVGRRSNHSFLVGMLGEFLLRGDHRTRVGSRR